jgi:hypothetical protein
MDRGPRKTTTATSSGRDLIFTTTSRDYRMWRFRGSPHYLLGAAKRFSIGEALVKECQHVKQLFRVSTLLAQLNGRYHSARKENGKAVLDFGVLAQVKGALEQCEYEVDKLHASAAASAVMMDEAWAAFGLDAPVRHYAILDDYDPPLSDADPAAERVPDTSLVSA